MMRMLSPGERYGLLLHRIASRCLYPVEFVGKWVVGIFAAAMFVCTLPWVFFSRKYRAHVWVNQAKDVERRSDIPLAVELYVLALQQDSKCWDAHLGLCRCYLAQVKLDQAKMHGEMFLKQNPLHAEGNLYMAAVLHYQGYSAEALKLLEQAERLYPEKYKQKARLLITKIKRKMRT